MNIMRKFSVSPKNTSENCRSTMVYPVLYVYQEENFDVFVIRGDNGSPENLRYYDVTVEDIEL